MNAKSALVVLSGGQDSTTCLFDAKATFSQVHAITFNYGQRHSREIDAAVAVGKLAKVDSHTIVHFPDILQGASPLTNKSAKLETYSDYESMGKIIGDRVELTFVPMRNAIFLNLAANYAVSMGIYAIFTGVCEADNANYPDCRQSFIDAEETAINEALGATFETGDYVSIFTPLIRKTKAESVKSMLHRGLEVFAVLGFTHTAYDGKFPPTGKDHASVLRAQGFLEARLPDPLVLRACSKGLMELPKDTNYQDHLFNGDVIKLMDSMESYLAVETDSYNLKVIGGASS